MYSNYYIDGPFPVIPQARERRQLANLDKARSAEYDQRMLAQTEAYGFKFAYPAGDRIVGRALDLYGEFARVEAALAAQLAAGATFIDVGANIGAIALPVSRRARRVIAIEAHRGLAEVLALNVADNGVTNIEVIHAAAGASEGEAMFPTPPLGDDRNYGDNGFGTGDGPLEPVRVITVDAIAPADTRIVKIDVQGFENDVLAGAAETLARTRPVWIVEATDDGPSPRATIATFERAGYAVYWFYSPFVTRVAPKRSQQGSELVGDLNVAAFPAEGPQPRDMVRVDLSTGWPKQVSAYPYLHRYGFEGARPGRR